MQSAVKLDHVCFSYKSSGNFAIDNLCLSLEYGTFVCIAGAGASGKTTVAKLAASLLVPESGTVETGRPDCTDSFENGCENGCEKGICPRVGYVFQNPDDSFVARTVEEEVAFGPGNLGLTRTGLRECVDRALAFMGISHLAERKISSLSGGEKQRVAIASVLSMKPCCLILDESTSMTDVTGNIELTEKLRRLVREENLCVVLITHNMTEATDADRLVILKDGAIAADGRPDVLLADEKLIESCGLELPPAVRVASGLRKNGIAVPENAVSVQSVAASIRKLTAEGVKADETLQA